MFFTQCIGVLLFCFKFSFDVKSYWRVVWFPNSNSTRIEDPRENQLRLMCFLSEYCNLLFSFTAFSFQFSGRLTTNLVIDYVVSKTTFEFWIVGWQYSVLKKLFEQFWTFWADYFFYLPNQTHVFMFAVYIRGNFPSWTDLRTRHCIFEYCILLRSGRERSDTSFWIETISFWRSRTKY